MFEKSSRLLTPHGELTYAPAHVAAPGHDGLTALVVDDEPDIVYVIQHQLQRLGFSSTSAGSVREARQLLSEQTFDLAVVDLLLPGPSGSDLVRILNGDDRHRQTAVVVASVLDDGSDQVDADARITKPFRPGQLAAAVESARRHARLRAGGPT